MVDAGEVDQQLKSANAYRTVPLHSALIGHQFLDYVESRRGQGQVFLFDDKPSGKDDDWAHNITCRFQRHFNDAGIVGQAVPRFTGCGIATSMSYSRRTLLSILWLSWRDIVKQGLDWPLEDPDTSPS